MAEGSRSITNHADLQQSFGPEVAHEHNAQYAPEVFRQENVPYVIPNSYKPEEQNAPYQYQPLQPNVEQPGASSDRAKKRICGLTVLVFWVVIAIIVVVFAVAIGVGVAVGLKNSNSNNNSQTSPQETSTTPPFITTTTTTTGSSTTTTSAATPTQTFVTSGSTGLAANSCNFTAPRTYRAPDGTSFLQFCFTDWPRGDAAADGNGQVVDLTFTTLYTFEDCIGACIQYNKNLPSGSAKCQAVTYNSNLTDIVAPQGGNCFLKNKKGQDRQAKAESACAVMVA